MTHISSIQAEPTDIVICGPDNPKLARRWSSAGGWERSDGEALHVVVGPDASDERCIALAQRFHLDSAGLMAFRDAGSRGVFIVEQGQ